MVPSRRSSPSAHPVEALTKSTSCSSWVPRQTRAQFRPPLLVVRMVPLPTAQTTPVSPTAWTASSRWMRPRGRLVAGGRSEEHTSELQSLTNLVCRLLLEKKKICAQHRRLLSGVLLAHHFACQFFFFF